MSGESRSSARTSDVSVADGHDRYVPDGPIDLCAGGHLSFYEWVATEVGVGGKRVLDLGCGSGYGVARLAEVAERVDGIDQSPVAIAYANEHYARPNTRFVISDLSDGLPPECAPGAYDVAVSSEVIEHVEDLFAFAAQLRAAVGESGVVVIGTPNRLWSHRQWPDGRLAAASHVMEMTPATLTGLMQLFFGDVALYMHVFPSQREGGFSQRLARATLRSAGAFATEFLGYGRYLKLRSYVHLPHSKAAPDSGGYGLDQFPFVPADRPGLDPGHCWGMSVICRDPL